MTCETFVLPGGRKAIVCSSRRTPRCACGHRAPYLCDWKVPARRSGTCDAPLCDRCASSPAPEKHLCQDHALAFDRWTARQAQGGAR